jgi:primosomal protein N' (replication factor Y)
MKYFAKVILPLALSQRYTYAIPDNLIPFCKIGVRVEVNFGKQKIYTAIVAEITTDSPSDYLPKEILNIIDDTPIISTNQLQLWQWIAKYYMCTEGEVMDAALPNYFKLKSNTAYLRNFDVDFDIHNISDEEYLIIEAFQQQTLLSHQDIDLILMHKKVAKTIKSLLERKLILIEEQLDIKYKPKTNLAIKWSQRIIENKELIKSAFDLTEKSPKQQQLLLAYIELSKTKNEITKKDLLKRCDANSSSIDSLIEKDIFQQYDTQIHRINTEASSLKNEILLTEAQQEAKNKIEIHWKEKKHCTIAWCYS